ncbi:conserved hypothetical protein [uncultured Dysgonomonas sp.]|uniref:Uncharacterized protein n=1 Tax=uncultured Dysgonomonas sp. TaxID=206096 RepID=A0A212K8W1_9BACT|nr:carboxypeptidase-like regulatory domain-containing protein [uncultured Dysgonomonas sp.]SBW08144.1 conserved hypothetical protein [uncultured Dysgonomonas sp.]
MRSVLFLILFVCSINTFSQRKVLGIIVDENNNPLIGVKVQEQGTDNYVDSGLEGEFQIITLKDTCVLSFSMLGLSPQKLYVTNNVSKSVKLRSYDRATHRITIGANYDFINSVLGVQISNGYDERALIHFEDFLDKIIYKTSFKTNFGKDYGFGVALGWLRPLKFVDVVSVRYDQMDYNENVKLDYRNINLSGSSYIRAINSSLIFNTGVIHLNKKNDFGIGVGLEKLLFVDKIYAGFLMGYYFDYYIYSVYTQSLLLKKKC